MAIRRCNEANPQDVCKAIRANLPLLEPKDATLRLEDFCSTHHELMKDILQITKRPTKQLLGKALKKVFPSQEPQEVNGFVSALTTHFTSLFSKARNMSTGSRLPRVVLELCLFIKKSILNTDAKASLATQLKARAREQLSPEHRKKSRTSGSPQVGNTPPSKADVAALYGMPALPIDPIDEAEPSCSAGGPEKAQSTSSKPEANNTSIAVDGNYLCHLDFCTGIMTKKRGDQEALVAEMAPGPDGFVLATFKEGSKVEVKQTEMPNLNLEMIRGKSSGKAKAKAKPKAKSKAKAKAKGKALGKAKAKSQGQSQGQGQKKGQG